MYSRPTLKEIEGEWVKLEILNSKRHCIDLYEMANSSGHEGNSIFKFMAFGPFQDQNEFDSWLEKQAQLNDRLTYSVYSRRLNKYVGMYSIINIDENNGKAELGSIWYGKSAQKTEINTETTYKLLSYLLDELKYRRVEWKCDNENIASKNSALRLGFEYEGLFRKHMIIKNKNRDTAWYSIIDDEWPDKKEFIKKNLMKNYQENIK